MTRYSFVCTAHGPFEAEQPMAETTRFAACPAHGCDANGIKVMGNVAWQFPYGRDQFHGQSIRERQERQIALCKADGRKIEPVGARWV